jgi:hypothetical protein
MQILRLLEHKALQSQRVKRRNALVAKERKNPKRGAVRQEKATPTEPADANPSHKEDFTALLGEAAQAREEDD